MKIAVIGTGQMGSVVAAQLPKTETVLVVDTDEARAKACGETIKAAWTTRLSDCADCDAAILVTPASAVSPLIAGLKTVIKPGAIVMNMATSALLTPEEIANDRGIHIVDTKIVGNAPSMAQGNAPSALVVDTEDDAVFETIKSIMPGFTLVTRGNAAGISEQINRSAIDILKTSVLIDQTMADAGYSPELTEILIFTSVGGTVRSYGKRTLGSNGKNLLRIAKEELAAEGKLH